MYRNNRTPETSSSDTPYHIQHAPLINSTEEQINSVLTNSTNINEEHLIALTETEFPQFLQSQFECLNGDMMLDKERVEISCQVNLETDGFLDQKTLLQNFELMLKEKTAINGSKDL